jgi:hypothetical protein
MIIFGVMQVDAYPMSIFFDYYMIFIIECRSIYINIKREDRVEENTSTNTYMELIWIIQRRAHLFEFEFHENKCN